MASEEMRKKWGTIFMGDREASVEQLKAMRERVDQDRNQKNSAEDYMERVRQRAADRAREILGQAYAERQKVLEEAKAEAAVEKRIAAQECAKIKSEGESIRSLAQTELAKAQGELEEAAKIRAAAHEEGYRDGMTQAGVELQEFRAELGQSMAALMRAIERQRKAILENWRQELVELVKAAVQAGTGLVLQNEHENILRSLVYKSLDLLENRGSISARVNPQDEETVSELFRAARERFPELRQWLVSGDESIEPGGLIVESGTGSVDLRRDNFREMVNGVLEHLGLPEKEQEDRHQEEVANLVEKEVAHIASLTPEPDHPEPAPEETPEETPQETPEAVDAAPVAEESAAADKITETPETEQGEPEEPEPMEVAEAPQNATAPQQDMSEDPSLAELEEELFPLGEEPENAQPAAEPAEPDAPAGEQNPDSKILSEGGFL